MMAETCAGPKGLRATIGFSLAGTSIEAGTGSIATVTVDHDMMDGMTQLCFDSYVISDPNASPWYTSAQCLDFMIPFVPSTVTQEVTLNSFMLNSASFNVIPEDASIESVFADSPIL